tara:strand:+ start:946 stop:1347 length:402 start_codon:yes stop_codon:yes gene_type:complete
MQKYFDLIGISLSGMCLIHCVLTPLFIMMTPLIGAGFWSSHGLHESIIYLIIPTAVIALAVGCTRHRDFWVGFIGFIGICVLTIAVLVTHQLGINFVYILTIIGSILIISAHYRNRILCKRESFSCHSGSDNQ